MYAHYIVGGIQYTQVPMYNPNCTRLHNDLAEACTAPSYCTHTCTYCTHTCTLLYKERESNVESYGFEMCKINGVISHVKSHINANTCH